MKKTVFFIFPILLLLGGCGSHGPEREEPVCRVVQEITVESEDSQGAATRYYTDQHKMSMVLNYLRILDPWNRAADPTALEGTSYRITLGFSDGSYKQYFQKDILYLSSDGAVWKQIDPGRGIHLPLLLADMPSDPK